MMEIPNRTRQTVNWMGSVLIGTKMSNELQGKVIGRGRSSFAHILVAVALWHIWESESGPGSE